MPIAETVAELARCVADARDPLSEWERQLVSVLVDMPTYRDRDEICEWESLFDDAWERGAADSESSERYFGTGRLLGEIFELGRLNLYTEFSEGRTSGHYRFLVRELKVHHEINAPDDLDVSEW